MAEQPLQTSQDKHKLLTVRTEPQNLQVFREADTGGRIGPARLFLGQKAVGDLVRREPGCQVDAGRSKCDPMEEKEKGKGGRLVPDY